MGSEPSLIKVRLTNKGEDSETPWAHDLGPAPGGPPGARKVKLVNVPFMHAKPTWGDIIVVTPSADDFPTWDRNGIPWKQIATRIVEDGGRWTMIVDWVPTADAGTADEAFAALARACEAEGIVCEGAWGPRDREPGRTYLAVPKAQAAESVMQRLEALALPMRLIQIHPEPKRLARAQTHVGVTPEKPRKPAAPAPVAPAAATTAPGVSGTTRAPAPVSAEPSAPRRPAAAAKPAAKNDLKNSG